MTGLFTPFRAATPQLYADIDRTKAKMLDVPLNNIFGTLPAYLGSIYVNVDHRALAARLRQQHSHANRFRRAGRLASKNAILIAEFAQAQQEAGKDSGFADARRMRISRRRFGLSLPRLLFDLGASPSSSSGAIERACRRRGSKLIFLSE